ncbi:MAG: hypothetical protein IT529_05370 [Burkholderiales bacterium]|nr:hypothetical protein [Burkholderiales bacterium]
MRRSASREGHGVLLTMRVRSPYRCRECGVWFSVVSRRFYIVSTIVIAGVVGWVLLWLLHGILFLDFFRQVPIPAT